MTPVTITVSELSKQTGKSRSTIYEWASRDEDPLPLRYEKHGSRSGFLIVDEFVSWWKRNSVPYSERKLDG